jgi:hypothetical protein
MVNHPARSQKSQDAALRRLINKHNLAKIELIIATGGVFARALPSTWHPEVARRREVAFAGRDHTLSEATALRETFMAQVASAKGATLEEAVAALSAELAKGTP